MTEKQQPGLAVENPQSDTITLCGRDIPIITGFADQSQLRFYTENPRIYTHIWKENGAEPTQQEICDVLSKRDHVRDVLMPSIKANGGLIEPLLVRGRTVLEGNSRLAAYRMLASQPGGEAKWRRVRIRLLPQSIDDSDVFALLGEYHIVGKADWAPFEQAGYLYRRQKMHGATEDQLHNEIGIAVSTIRRFVKVYAFMLDVEDRDPARWSYYDELLRGRKFEKATEKYEEFVPTIVEKIKSGEIQRAVDVRDRLPLIVKAGGNTLKKFMSGKMDFEDAVTDARQRGAGDYNIKKLNDFRQWIADVQLEAEFKKVPEKEKGPLKFELDKIERRVKRLISILEGK